MYNVSEDYSTPEDHISVYEDYDHNTTDREDPVDHCQVERGGHVLENVRKSQIFIIGFEHVFPHVYNYVSKSFT